MVGLFRIAMLPNGTRMGKVSYNQSVMRPTEPFPPQNIYDDPDFFGGYARLRENPLSANTVLVAPACDALLPVLAGKAVLDLGCGAGDFCRTALERGASRVTGVDVSERMLAAARSQSSDPRLRYVQSALETFAAPAASVEIVVSILALHYIADISPILARVEAALVSGGTFIFCVEHPINTARRAGRDGSGWIEDEKGTRLYWAVDDYASEGERQTDWFVPGVRTYHRTLMTYLNAILDSGLRLTRVVEPLPDETTIAAHPAYRDAWRRPLFLFVRAEKP